MAQDTATVGIDTCTATVTVDGWTATVTERAAQSGYLELDDEFLLLDGSKINLD